MKVTEEMKSKFYVQCTSSLQTHHRE